jgi:DNA repair protein RecN (Recombination protein N)
VAARAQTHFLIAKAASGNDRVATSIRAMETDDRQEEIARMLAGASVTEEARAAAVRLLRENAVAAS